MNIHGVIVTMVALMVLVGTMLMVASMITTTVHVPMLTMLMAYVLCVTGGILAMSRMIGEFYEGGMFDAYDWLIRVSVVSSLVGLFAELGVLMYSA